MTVINNLFYNSELHKIVGKILNPLLIRFITLKLTGLFGFRAQVKFLDNVD